MEGWSVADAVLLVALLLFGLRAAWRGFLRSFFGVLAVIVGFAVAAFFYRDAAFVWLSWFPFSFATRSIVAFLGLFFITYFIVRLIGSTLHKGAEITMLGGMDRVFGFLFGIVQGIVVLMVVITIALLSPNPEKFHAWASQGIVAPSFTAGAEALANRTKKFTAELRAQLVGQLSKWGISDKAMDKLFADPSLMEAMVKRGEEHAATSPGVAIPAEQATYDVIKRMMQDSTMTNDEKSQRIWDMIVFQQESMFKRQPTKQPDNAMKPAPRYR